MSHQEMEAVERDMLLGWELYRASPTHPQIERIAQRLQATNPRRSDIRILLAKHRWACGRVAEAREILQAVVALRDERSLDAARELLSLEHHDGDIAEALRWAEYVLREEQDRWFDWMELGGMTALNGAFEEGWRILDDAVAMCARTSAGSLPLALVRRALYLLSSCAPPALFVPAAEEAVSADPSDENIGGPLMWAYLHEGRFDDAEELALRMLRLDPTNKALSQPFEMMRNLQATLAEDARTLDELHGTGLFERLWTQMRDRRLGLDLTAALAALDEVMPAELRAVLKPPVDKETARAGSMSTEIAMWHAGQAPGAGAAWGLPGDFRLMSAEEIKAMDDAIEADPDAYPQWRTVQVDEYYDQLMTDDAGAYLVELMTGEVVIRQPGAADERIAESLADLFWRRVAAFGGHDPRPRATG
ncbi:tetratricopeptide repeat protein [Phytomonospora endophytica]|uniref:Tetratricopeptide (TPR) repeat protein n=1 Tax=Phytomonospora endophytica TaxID=714109 RepID=A0A841FTC7_9ACTN|nr:tetratricopeptide repeat protein [Phytomonospora endophytica]MBB6039565.1 tetratricopeptide (TPR) repeat protein [Phytomonospora endophytica]GIG70531.1 hypothetical protein Pen01_68260 [Phytomonospora endophytica]